MSVNPTTQSLNALSSAFLAESAPVTVTNDATLTQLYKKAMHQITFCNPAPKWHQWFQQEFNKELTAYKATTAPEKSKQFYETMFLLLTQEPQPISLQCDTPKLLPLPLATSLVGKAPFTMQCKNNPVVQSILKHRIQNCEESSNLISWYVRKIFCDNDIAPSDKWNPLKLHFQQFNCEYELLINHKQLTYIFFPIMVASVAFDMPPKILYRSFCDLFMEYRYTVRDRRYQEYIPARAILFESLIVSDSLKSLPQPLIDSLELSTDMMRYIAFLMHHGITTSEKPLHSEIVQTLFTMAKRLLERQEHPERPQFYRHVFDAFNMMKTKDPLFAEWLSSEPTVAKSVQFFGFLPKHSLLLTDLSSQIEFQKPVVKSVACSEKIALKGAGSPG